MSLRFNFNEEDMFPMYYPDEVEAYSEFNEAFLLHTYPRTQNDIVEAVHKYHEIFEVGCLEAGVNLLNIIAVTIANALAHNAIEPRSLQSKLELCIEELEQKNHSAGAFYRAISLIYGIWENSDYGKAYEEGWMLMSKLYEEGNEFAIAMHEYAVSSQRMFEGGEKDD